MIVIYHQKNKVIQVDFDGISISFSQKNIVKTLLEIGSKYPDELLIWSQFDLKIELNFEKFNSIFHHHKIMVSYGVGLQNYISGAIGYVEESPFIKVNKSVSYPTWLMSSDVGGIHASVLNLIEDKIKLETNFNYFLNSVAKLGMLGGLFCYSEPLLLKQNPKEVQCKPANKYVLFRFVKQHYKKRWLLLLFFNLFFFEKQFPVLPFCYAMFYKNRKKTPFNLDAITVQSTLKTVNKKTIDVIIPTIGRKQYLYDVLQDLAHQTLLPKKVIIVEQNPIKESVSQLDYLQNENWPFIIKHIFTHQAGACNARNLALTELESEWVFLNDDDNRFEMDLLADIFFNITKYGVESIITAYPQVNEFHHNKNVMQSLNFGAGNSFVKSKLLKSVQFNIGYEFGYGEDADFGMQLRNQGIDILYLPQPVINHLKAPIGGFRTKPILKWHSEKIQPKPSPTVMLYQISHQTKEQILGYKTTLFFKYYSKQAIKNPFSYFINYRKQWNQSVYWANQLQKQS